MENEERNRWVRNVLLYLKNQKGIPSSLGSDMYELNKKDRNAHEEVRRYLLNEGLVSLSEINRKYLLTDKGNEILESFDGHISLYEERKKAKLKMEDNKERWEIENYLKEMETKDIAFRFRYLTFIISIIAIIDFVFRLIRWMI